jgi:hypothetical protein
LFSLFALVKEPQLEEEIDLDCDTGQAAYLESKAATPMTKNAMETNKPWQKWFDGLRHASLPVTDRHCQYCYYQYTYEMNDAQRAANCKMERNRAHVRRCLVCNMGGDAKEVDAPRVLD